MERVGLNTSDAVFRYWIVDLELVPSAGPEPTLKGGCHCHRCLRACTSQSGPHGVDYIQALVGSVCAIARCKTTYSFRRPVWLL